jgi:3-deoxy-D-manno-octulosonate 8-phosphate phosphatase (KDO 8-P phosphatase)
VKSQGELQALASRVALVVFDVDGVLTDGGLWYGPEGELHKRFDVKDGHGMVLARLTGLKVALLTARTSAIVETRAQELKLTHVAQGQRYKGPGLEAVCAALEVPLSATAYMGDDVNDVPALERCGLSACPADAVDEVRARVHLVCSRPGGRGAARELLDLVLKATGRWESAMRQMEP